MTQPEPVRPSFHDQLSSLLQAHGIKEFCLIAIVGNELTLRASYSQPALVFVLEDMKHRVLHQMAAGPKPRIFTP